MRWGTRSDQGAAAVEFALVLPVLVLMLFGIIQFGLIFNQWQQLEHATREGARWASLQNSAAAVRSTVIAAAPTLGLTAADITITPPNPTGLTLGTPVTVTSQIDVPVFTPGLLGMDPNVQLTATATQRSE
jgi:Flp pilus assembly protein TadG